MIRHHPSDATLLSHAAGALPAPHAQVVALHLRTCPHCRRALRLLEAAGGALLDRLAPAPLAPDALDRIVERLDEAPLPAARPPVPAAASSTLDRLATGRWRWCGPGVHMMPLVRRDAADTRLDLIRVAPGTALLEHGHTGFETTVVLQGAFDDGIDRYDVGDFAEADGETGHCPRALAGPACICLIATSGHLSAKGLLGRLVRPLLGM